MTRILSCLLVFCAYPCAATTLQQLSMDQMTQSATAIVRARVTASSASFAGSTIYTHYQLQVSEIWKGSGATEVMVPGGVAGGYRQSFAGMPTLQPGSEYVLFLWTSSITGITHLVGFSQGLYNVTALADGTLQASRPQIGEGMLDALGRIVRDQAVQMPLATMKAQVSATVAAGTAQ